VTTGVQTPADSVADATDSVPAGEDSAGVSVPPAPPPPPRVWTGRLASRACRHLSRWRTNLPRWTFGGLSAIVLLPFVWLFLSVSIQRLGIPYNLEWNEGQSAEQAWRFAQSLPLYPEPGDGWVPYMYAPLYHWVFGLAMRWSGETTLFWGRLISWLATLATVAAIVAIVRDRTLRWLPGLVAAGLYLAYYKATGFWYDIARNDALAFGIGAWALYLTLKRKPAAWQVALGGALFIAATLAKQTMGPLALFSFAWLFLRRNRAAGSVALVAVLFSLNFTFLYQSGDNPAFVKYALTNAQRHLSNWGAMMPGNQQPAAFVQNSPDPESLGAAAREYWRQSREKPAQFWTEGGRHVWLVALLVPAWLLLALLRRQWPRGWIHAVPAVLLTLGAIGSYVKYGGFVNNFLPMYLGWCVLAGFAFNGILRAFPGLWRMIPAVGLPVLLFLQVHQPWRQDMAEPGAARWRVVRWIHDAELRAAVEREFRRRDGATEEEPSGIRARWIAALTPWVESGLLWFPFQQLPPEEWTAVHEEFLAWLEARAAAGEPVWVMHHQFYGIQTNHPISYNVDMVRCAVWAGDPVPRELASILRDGQYKWLVLDMPQLQWEWLPAGTPEAIREHYENLGRHPALAGKGEQVLMPVTGAEVRPTTLYRLKGFGGTP
jgi:hypothetical protein